MYSLRTPLHLRSFPTRRSSDLLSGLIIALGGLRLARETKWLFGCGVAVIAVLLVPVATGLGLRDPDPSRRSEEHTSELQSQFHLVCRLLLEKKKDMVGWVRFHV